MKTWRFQLVGVLALSVIEFARAQPELEVRGAYSRLIEAENYSWESAQEHVADSLKARRIPALRVTGETIIGGYTTVTAYRRQAVLRGVEAALKLKSGWRLAADLTDEDVFELNGGAMTLDAAAVEQPASAKVVRGAKVDRMRHYMIALPHEILSYLLRDAKNFRVDGPAIAADVAFTDEDAGRLEIYLRTGKMPALGLRFRWAARDPVPWIRTSRCVLH